MSYHCNLTELVTSLHVWGHLKCLLCHDVYDRVALYRVNWQHSRCRVYCSSVFCHHVVSAYSHVVWCTVCCLCVMPRTKGLTEGQWAEWTALAGRLCLCACVCCCVTVGEYHDIKQYHSGLCALTQGTLCTFLQGWGDGGEVGGGGHSMVAACFLHCHSCVSLGKSYGKHNGKAITWKQ